MCVVIYLLVDFIRFVGKYMKILYNFEKYLNKLVTKKISEKKRESFINAVGLYLSGRDVKDIENLSIAYTVRGLVKKFRKKKVLIVVRVLAYAGAVILFKETASDVLQAFLH